MASNTLKQSISYCYVMLFSKKDLKRKRWHLAAIGESIDDLCEDINCWLSLYPRDLHLFDIKFEKRKHITITEDVQKSSMLMHFIKHGIEI